MFMHEWIENLGVGLKADLLNFSPELALCSGIIVLLLLRLFKFLDRMHLSTVAMLFTLLGLALAFGQWRDLTQTEIRWHVGEVSKSTDLFAGMLAFDKFTVFLRLFLLGFTALVIWLTTLTGIPDREDSADFYSLLLGATLGMSIMASANHLLMVFIGIEMASLPSYALAGFLKGKRQSSEAALKYVVYGGGASGIMLYGISLLAGRFGTGYLPDLAKGFGEVVRLAPATGGALGFDAILVLGTLFILVGIGFKLAAVPFHFWCPDVFEGASAEVAAFLSVASKGAALALLARFLLVLSGLGAPAVDVTVWLKLARYFAPGLAVFAALTATFGNLAAYVQTNLKRLLAYSTIAHAGYMMMGLATLTPEGAGAVLFYLVPYLFMNLGAFAIVAFLRNQTGSEDLSSFRGLIQRAPLLVVALAFCLFSLLGLPPLGGFAAKFQIFQVLYDAGKLYADKAPALSYTMYALLFIGGINSVLSLVYYIKVLKVMALDKSLDEVEGRMPPPLPLRVGPAAYATLMAVAVLLLGILWDPLARASDQGVDRFHTVQVKSSGPATQAPGGGMMSMKKGGGPKGGGKGKGKGQGKQKGASQGNQK
jgi:NADH-quinone oxidoreductase subunit N